ncbi:MAG: hypothetical protein RLZZ522_120 [Verrucomicrobiota bacterium]
MNQCPKILRDTQAGSFRGRLGKRFMIFDWAEHRGFGWELGGAGIQAARRHLNGLSQGAPATFKMRQLLAKSPVPAGEGLGGNERAPGGEPPNADSLSRSRIICGGLGVINH